MARIDERFDEARRAVARLTAVAAPASPDPNDPADAAALVGEARLLRFVVAFEAVWFAGRQLMLDRYGPIQGTADGTIRACGDVGLLSDEAVAQLRETARFQAGVLEAARRDGPAATVAALEPHVAAVVGWLAALEPALDRAPGPAPQPPAARTVQEGERG